MLAENAALAKTSLPSRAKSAGNIQSQPNTSTAPTTTISAGKMRLIP